jgi:hypothetical protein
LRRKMEIHKVCLEYCDKNGTLVFSQHPTP